MPQGFGQSLAPIQSVNPFVGALSAPATPQPGQAGTTAVVAPGQEEPEVRKGGWKAFVDRFKNEPDLRLALFQAALSLTQPSDSPAEAIGRSLNTGLGTFQALEQTRYERSREAETDALKERTVAADESRASTSQQQLELAQQGQTEDVRQFNERQQLAQQERQDRLKAIESDAEYRRDLISLRKQELEQGQGVVNSQWNRLRDVLLQVNRDQYSDDTETATNEATAEAWNLLRGSQGRADLKARLLGNQSLFYTNNDGTLDRERFLNTSQAIDAALDAAGVTDTTIQNFRGSGTTQQGETVPPPEMVVGAQGTFNGNQFTIVALDANTVTLQFPDGRTQTVQRAPFETRLGISQSYAPGDIRNRGR